ncbi:hydroxypyruvate isomerase family protein [Terriglobus saanensis]|uniref:Hydroxypyruvate isomerase n=1 Tax=Terriglobus saanensis (strain ATCC BAA-1853 / DSM 23119 / SP1PR4) TaxID=401053 RepID=E8V2J0_TERSS|nr:TIM barrel protein [Terriglobus saanensis]ADV82408.1 Hydroxypyruvate isomerase [Terriglobus saanensis SP1PR4]
MNRRKFGQLIVATALEGTFLCVASQLEKPLASSPRFSCEIATLNLASFDRCIEIVAEAGYQGVELTGYFQKWTPEEQRRLMGKMRSLGVMIDMLSGLQASFAIPDQAEEFVTRVTSHCRVAKGLECPQINIKSGKRLDGVEPQVQFAAAVDNLKRASDVAARNGINIVIEPIDLIENPTIFLTSVKEGFEIVRAVNRPNVKVLYDFYHEQRGAGNLIEKLEANIDWVGLVHIADVPGRHEPGTGEIDYTNIYRSLGRLHYNGFIAMEYGSTTDAVASLRKSRIEAQKGFAEGLRL